MQHDDLMHKPKSGSTMTKKVNAKNTAMAARLCSSRPLEETPV